MNAYASGFRCNQLALIYPWHEGLANSSATSFALSAMEGLNPVVDILCVDVFNNHLLCRSAPPNGEFARLLGPSRTLVSDAASA
jgi:5-methylcytosine-specific restriction enzyme subunit McrC